MNLPIKITFIRFLLSPLFAVFLFIANPLLSSILCLLCVIGAIYSDIMDGYIARSRNQITITGKLLDPIADVTFYITAFSALYIENWIPLFVLFILALREIGINIIIRPIISYLSLNPQAKIFGKLKTVFQSIIVIMILLARVIVFYYDLNILYPIIYALSYILALFSILSAVPYIMILQKKRDSI